MIRLRLQRRGRKRRPYYHVVAADQRSPRDGRVIERLGRFDNVSEQKQLILDEERVIHWLQIGAQPSDTVRSLLKSEGIMYKMHLLRWGKSEEEIEAALAEWREKRAEKGSEKEVSRKALQKEVLEAEEKEYRKQVEEKAAEAARQAKQAKAEAEAKAAEEAKEAEKAEAAEAEKAPEPETKSEEEVEAGSEEAAPEKAEADTPETKTEATEESSASVESTESPEQEVKKADETKEKEPEEDAGAATSTEMNATDAIEYIKDHSLEDLKGFVTDDEDRVTVQRAWESKQAE